MIEDVQYDIMPEQLVKKFLNWRDEIHEAADEAYSRPKSDTESLYKHQSAANMAQEIAEGLELLLKQVNADTAPYVCLMQDYAHQLQAYHLWSLRNVTNAAN